MNSLPLVLKELEFLVVQDWMRPSGFLAMQDAMQPV